MKFTAEQLELLEGLKTHRITVRVTEKMYKKYERVSKHTHVPKPRLLRYLIAQYIDDCFNI